MNFLAFGDRAGRHMYERGDGWFPIGAIVGMLLLAGLVAAIVVLATRASRRHAPTATAAGLAAPPTTAPAGHVPSAADDALNLLRLRYARGEVSRDEYLQTAADLGGVIVPVGPAVPTVAVAPDAPVPPTPAS